VVFSATVAEAEGSVADADILMCRRGTAGAASLSLHPLTRLPVRLGVASPTLLDPLAPVGEREG